MLNDILDFSKIEAGHLNIECIDYLTKPIDPTALRVRIERLLGTAPNDAAPVSPADAKPRSSAVFDVAALLPPYDVLRPLNLHPVWASQTCCEAPPDCPGSYPTPEDWHKIFC